MLLVCSQLRLASTSARSPRRPCARVCGARSRSRGGLPVFVGVRFPASALFPSTSPTSPASWRLRSPLSSFARVGPGALEPWRANHFRVAARLSDFLVVAASRSFLLIPLSVKLAAFVWVRLAWARGFGWRCHRWESCSQVLALGKKSASLGLITSGSGRTGLALPVDLGRLF